MNSELQDKTDIRDVFFDTEGLDLSNSSIISIDSTVARKSQLLRQHMLEVPPGSEFLVVVIDDSEFPLFKKLINLFLRRHTVRACCRVMAQSNFFKIGTYALYPDLENLFLAYQTDSTAASYAEKYVINGTSSFLKKVLNKIFKRLGMGSPVIDIIAIVGSRA